MVENEKIFYPTFSVAMCVYDKDNACDNAHYVDKRELCDNKKCADYDSNDGREHCHKAVFINAF